MAKTEIGTQQHVPFTKSGKRSSVFSVLIAALHESRRLQAARIIRSYQYLRGNRKQDIRENRIA